MHVEFVSYQLKGIERIWSSQLKKNTVERALHLTWVLFEDSFLGCFFPRTMREAKIIEFLSETKIYECATVQP